MLPHLGFYLLSCTFFLYCSFSTLVWSGCKGSFMLGFLNGWLKTHLQAWMAWFCSKTQPFVFMTFFSPCFDWTVYNTAWEERPRLWWYGKIKKKHKSLSGSPKPEHSEEMTELWLNVNMTCTDRTETLNFTRVSLYLCVFMNVFSPDVHIQPCKETLPLLT